MRLITLDMETHYAPDYSLSKLTTEAYVRDPRFEALILGYKIDNAPTRTAVGAEIPLVLAALQLDQAAVLMHHAHFDAFILWHHYRVRPRIILDTLAMARAAVGSVVTRSYSLGSLAKHYGLGEKGAEVIDAKGKRLADFTYTEMEAYRGYCANDVELTYQLGEILRPEFSVDELRLIDLTTRCFTEPLLELDSALLEEYKLGVEAHKAYLMLRAGVLQEDLMSNDKFAAALRRCGCEPPTKVSPRTGKPAFAFAKTDEAMQALLEHPDELVQALAEARLGVKTTIAETRAQRFIDMGGRGPAPVYLKYWGAEQTGRHGGGDRCNWLNLSRNRPLDPELIVPGSVVVTPQGRARVEAVDAEGVVSTALGTWPRKKCHRLGLRDGVRAPEGYTLVVGDSSNIEARKICFLAGQEDILERYRAGEDLYCYLASDVFGRTVTKADTAERTLGKVGTLGLGFGMGADKFTDTVRRWGIDVEAAVAAHTVDVFRTVYHKVKTYWKYLGDIVIPAMAAGQRVAADVHGLVATDKNALVLPNGRRLRYPNLRFDRDDGRYGSWLFDLRDGARVLPSRLYGGKIAENITQAMARIVVMEQAIRISRRFRVVLLVYDEVVCCVPQAQADACQAFMQEVLSTPPAWAPQLPVAAEVSVGEFYGGAKG